MIRKFALCLLCLCLVLTGCTGGDTLSSEGHSAAYGGPYDIPASSLPGDGPVSGVGDVDSSVSLPGSDEPVASQPEEGFIDSLGTVFLDLPENPRTVSLYGSYAEAWLLAGGELAGVTGDALEERDFGLPADIPVVGSVKEPNAEAIIALEPDLVILNPDISGQLEIRDVLENAGLHCAYFRVDTFEDYDMMMGQFTKLTGRSDLYKTNVVDVAEQIQEAWFTAALSSYLPDVLLIRAFSTGIKAKTDDELAGAILKDLNAHNIADDHPSMLEDLSLEEIIQADPDFIFVTTMGDEEKALAYLDSLIDGNPAWQELTAVKEGRYVVLPKDLFHYKPNNRWGESYAYLGKILYPTLFRD